MLTTYTFKRSAKLLVTMIFATLALVMTEQSANAQPATREVIAYLGSVTFDIETNGCGYVNVKKLERFWLKIRVDDTDRTLLVGKYYRRERFANPDPPPDNVRGTIAYSGGRWEDGGTYARVTFVVGGSAPTTAPSVVVDVTNFEGAILFPRRISPEKVSGAFMAGTFTHVVGGIGRGPFPFFAEN